MKPFFNNTKSFYPKSTIYNHCYAIRSVVKLFINIHFICIFPAKNPDQLYTYFLKRGKEIQLESGVHKLS